MNGLLFFLLLFLVWWEYCCNSASSVACKAAIDQAIVVPIHYTIDIDYLGGKSAAKFDIPQVLMLQVISLNKKQFLRESKENCKLFGVYVSSNLS